VTHEKISWQEIVCFGEFWIRESQDQQTTHFEVRKSSFCVVNYTCRTFAEVSILIYILIMRQRRTILITGYQVC
jgi:hypothetical protein